MELLRELRTAIDRELETLPTRQLVKCVAELSDRYRTGGSGVGGRFVQSPEDAVAYTAFRLPATYAAVCFALGAVQVQFPHWQPRSLLDVGAGPGTVMWAATHPSLWADTLERITLLEREANMISVGKRLAACANLDSIREAQWRAVDITQPWEIAPFDLVVASYVLGEIPIDKRDAFIDQLWQMTNHVLVIVEPGTPIGFDRIREAKGRLISMSGKTVAPCPHDRPCPMEGDDWCHFPQRVARSRIHRQAKAVELGYEDEKLSFISVARQQAPGVLSRVIRRPQVHKGHIRLQLCTPQGLVGRVVTRKDQELFRRARDVKWGNSFDYHLQTR